MEPAAVKEDTTMATPQGMVAFDNMGNDASMFFIGKTGHGKSTSGNTVLGRDAFDTSDSTSSHTFHTQCAWGRFKGRVVKVIDGPGVSETRLGQGRAAEKLLQDMRQGLFFCPEGFDVLILVFRYGGRFTQEEVGSVLDLKSCFGPDFLSDFGVILFTHGEQFDMQNKKKRAKDKVTFDEWVHSQTGELQELVRECGGRYVLFHNLDETKRDDEVSELLKIVDSLKRRGRRYTTDLFEKIKIEHEKFYARKNATELKNKMQRKVDLLQYSLSRVVAMGDICDVDTLTVEVDQLLKDAWGLQQEIQHEDKQTGVLAMLTVTVGDIEQVIETHRRSIQNRVTREAVKDETDHLTQRLDDLSKKLKATREYNTPGENQDNSAFWNTLSTIGTVLSAGASAAAGAFLCSRGQVVAGVALITNGIKTLTGLADTEASQSTAIEGKGFQQRAIAPKYDSSDSD